MFLCFSSNMFVCNSDLVSYEKSQCYEVEVAITIVLCVNIWKMSLPNSGWIFGNCRRPCFADWIMQLEHTTIEAIASYGRVSSVGHGFVFKTCGFLPKRKNRKRFPADLMHHRFGSLNYIGTNNSSSCRQLPSLRIFVPSLAPCHRSTYIRTKMPFTTSLEFGLETRCQNRTDLC
jgi:hypothetical protein